MLSFDKFSRVPTGGWMTPNSVIIPPDISSAGVTSKAGFQHSMPGKDQSRS
jgi:hypothetical protein